MRVINKDLIIMSRGRPGRKLRECLAVVMHGSDKPNMRAKTLWEHYNDPNKKVVSSIHYIVDLNGDILRCIPEDEIAYHIWTKHNKEALDIDSNRKYTNWARDKLGFYAHKIEQTSPDFCTISIEMCETDRAGHFTEQTYWAAVWLAADVLHRNRIGADRLTTHWGITGHRRCPKLWCEEPRRFEKFQTDVAAMLDRMKAPQS